ncbi:MAG: AsmA family protein [Deltaproteobacteria bacterium]
MKILKIALISFLVLVLILITALIIFVTTFDVNRFKPQIVTQAGNALNRKVDFDKAQLTFSFNRGVSLSVSNLVIADDPAFAKGDFLTAKDISLSVDVLGYIFQKKISISGVLVDGFHVTIIRQKDGSLNVQSIAQSAGSKAGEQKPDKPSPPMALPVILVSSFKGSNGEVAYFDRSFAPPIELTVSDLGFILNKISLTEEFPFALEGRVLSAKKNIHAEGQVRLNLSTNEITLSGLKGETDLSQIILEKIPVSFPMLKGVVLPMSLNGTARLELEKMAAGPKGLTALAGDVRLNGGSLQFEPMAVPLKDVQIQAKVTQAKIILDTMSASLGGGTIKGGGSLEDYLTNQAFNVTLNADNIQLDGLVKPDMLPVKAKGVASGQLQLKGKGFTPQALSSFLSGTGNISLKKIVLEDINVFQRVLGKLSMIPGLTEKIESAVPERYAQALKKKDTELSDMALPIVIENGRVVIKDTTFSAEAFSLKASTEVGFDGSYAMEGSFLIPDDLSAAMVNKVPELQYILNEDKQIFIPIKVSGKAAGANLNVDAGYIAQKLLTNQAKTQLLKVLNKAVGQTGNEPAGTSGQQPAQDSGTKEQPSLEDVGKSILGNILKK